MNKSSLTRSIPADMRDVVIARTARIPHVCICRDEHRYFTVTSKFARPVDGVKSVSSTWPNFASAEAHAAWAREARREAEVTVEPHRNPNYRAGCLGQIKPGDTYGDYVGESGAYESGQPYCSACTVAVWTSKEDA